MKNRAVWKFLLNIGRQDITQVRVSANHKVLRIGFDPQGHPSVWVEMSLTDANLPEKAEQKEFIAFWTGDRITPDTFQWAGTITDDGLVYHLYTDANL